MRILTSSDFRRTIAEMSKPMTPEHAALVLKEWKKNYKKFQALIKALEKIEAKL